MRGRACCAVCLQPLASDMTCNNHECRVFWRELADDTPADASAESVLSEAARLVDGDRQQAYGHPRDNHACTAALWNAWIERRYNALHDRDGSVDIGSLLDARAVCWLNILQKASRDAHSPSRDSLVDTAGFARNAEMVGDDL